MIVTKMALPRRAVLRGIGATLALPFLDAMVPAMSAHGEDAGRHAAPSRLHLPPQRRLDEFQRRELLEAEERRRRTSRCRRS